MKRTAALFLCAGALAAATSSAIPETGNLAAALAVGSTAPELKVSKWFKGEAVESLAPDQTYVVEFWATWCPPCRSSIPHLTKLAHAFTNITFIGLNIGESDAKGEDTVEKFVANMGERMDYRVAGDSPDGFMETHWMQASGQRGIPAAFVVQNGLVIWIGHPVQGLEDILQEISAGSFGLDQALSRAAEAKAAKLEWQKRTTLFADYAEAVGPDGDSQDAAALTLKIEKLDIQDPDRLNELAWFILTGKEVIHRDLPLATRLAKRALDATGEKRADILDTYARAMWDSGQRADALSYQRKAVAAEPNDLGIAITLQKYEDALDPAGSKLALKTERFSPAALVWNGAIYVLGGHSDHGFVADMERFSADSTETEKVSSNFRPRRYHAAVAHNGKFYLAGGNIEDAAADSGEPTSSVFEELDPATGTLRPLPNMPVTVSRAGAAVVDNRLYVIGGAPQFGLPSPAVQIFDFQTETWSCGADLPIAREGTVFESDGKIYAPGGYDGNTALRKFQVYDPRQDAWSAMPDLPEKTSAHSGAVIDGQLYVFGDYAVLDRVAVYDFAAQTWALLDVGYKSARHAAAIQLGEEVFVVGGNVQSGPPYLNRIQRFTAHQLAEAPRRKWRTPTEIEIAPTPTRILLEERLARASRGAITNAPAVRRISCCGRPRVTTPPDPRFFRLKWKKELNDNATGASWMGKMDWRIPPRHLALTSENTLFIHRADDGSLLHSIPLPPEAQAQAKKDTFGNGRFSFVYIQEGDQGYAIGTRTLYQVTETESGRHQYKSLGEQWICLTTAGKLRWNTEDASSGIRGDLHALPISPTRDRLLVDSWNGFKILDMERRILAEQAHDGSWIFQPGPAGKGVEARVIGKDIACYEVVIPAETSAQETRSASAEHPLQQMQERLETPASAPKAVKPVEPRSSKIDFYTNLLDKNPNNINALHWRGFLYAMRGDAKASRRDFGKAIRLAPDAPNIRWSYGWALLNLGDYDQSVQQWEIMGELDKEIPPKGDHHLALAYWAAGHKEKALEIFNETVARGPGFWISREHARRHTEKWTEKEKAILFSLYDAWCRIYSPPADPADYPLPKPYQPASEP